MSRLRIILIAHDSKKADLVEWARGPARFHATTDELRFHGIVREQVHEASWPVLRGRG